MVVIVCGSREWTDPEPIWKCLRELPEQSIVIHGAQRGADTIAGKVAGDLGLSVMPVEAEWRALGAKAGPLRNDKMLEMLLKAAKVYNQPVKCHAFHHDAKLGVGTRDMVRKCLQERVRCTAFVIPEPPMVRSSGDFVCRTCKLPYRKHPVLTSVIGMNDETFLELSCDGIALKL